MCVFIIFVGRGGKVGQPQIRQHLWCLKTASLESCKLDFRRAFPNPLDLRFLMQLMSPSYISITEELIRGVPYFQIQWLGNFPWGFCRALSSLMFCHSPPPPHPYFTYVLEQNWLVQHIYVISRGFLFL